MLYISHSFNRKIRKLFSTHDFLNINLNFNSGDSQVGPENQEDNKLNLSYIVLDKSCDGHKAVEEDMTIMNVLFFNIFLVRIFQN
jgi:hypothetical protein